MSTWQKLGTSVAVTVSVFVTCLCWSLGHGEQLLFSCVSSKVSICNYVTCYMSHVTCCMWHVTGLMSNAYIDPWDMLNNFCFHVLCLMTNVTCYMWNGYGEKWVFVIMSHVTFRLSHVTCHIAHVTCHM